MLKICFQDLLAICFSLKVVSYFENLFSIKYLLHTLMLFLPAWNF